MTSKIAVISLAGLLLMSVAPAFATVVTGELDTGVSSGGGIDGVLIVAPTASPAAGDYSSDQSVTLTATGSNSIHYTTSGTDPTCTTGTTYSSAISVDSDMTIEAISCYANGGSSTVASFAYEISSGGGGGGSGSSSNDTTPTTIPISQMTLPQLQAEVARLTIILNQLIAAAAAGEGEEGADPAGCYPWPRGLRLGMSGADVTALQNYLIGTGHFTYSGGATGYFGAVTQAAVAAWQAANGISPAVGFWGILSQTKYDSMCAS